MALSIIGTIGIQIFVLLWFNHFLYRSDVYDSWGQSTIDDTGKTCPMGINELYTYQIQMILLEPVGLTVYSQLCIALLTEGNSNLVIN
jgi:hypothetical protein